ncbi:MULTISPECIES: GNAT family N-acetyltransferase [Brevundimonas]|uniref:GNAT family N-acetyltransferase n=1 Tax=Brevundimonas TaxID=41275 RepID=UPI0019080CFA|nr:MULTISPECIES: GNAT family N-acetyltransferase [Brevundimonas]MDA0742370.1 GNAT family N-acetyltransferase [Pseudomonadota bacterium]MBK1969467.1 GNAT family N-acetyltransferase [Brevundimonas diminuta]MBK1975248.1 GNAT family N-acetyltransferase [Brevundimonas diminuta]MDA1321097.1 GNAT family N-acetyltransferase [Pseudomonadota bacterium]MDM8352141.1 GNAT family N-acetyltransferase [Brevundimonas diminuta]
MSPDYRIAARTPAIDDYRRLRTISGLTPRSAEAAAAGLPNTVFAVVIENQADETVGMGRVIGDNGLFFQIVDIAGDPAHQGRGLGKAIMKALVDHLRATVPAEAYISLIADGEAHRLYAQYGFQPTAPNSIGMALFLRPNEA